MDSLLLFIEENWKYVPNFFILKDWWFVQILHFEGLAVFVQISSFFEGPMGNLPNLGCNLHATRKSCSFLCFPGIWIRPRQQTNSDYNVDSDDLKKKT